MKTLTLPKTYGLFDLMKTDLNTKSIEDLFYPNIPTTKTFSNIRDNDDHVKLEMTVPGFKKSEIEITVENNLINISGKKEKSFNDETENFIIKEYSVNEFKKSFKVNPEMNIELIESSLENGILELKIPKAKKNENKKIIKIK